MSYTHFHIPESEVTDIHSEVTLKLRLSVLLGGKNPLGFYQYYFNDLPYHKNLTECFNHVNQIYFEIFGEYRYSDYGTFSWAYNKNYKKLLRNK